MDMRDGIGLPRESTMDNVGYMLWDADMMTHTKDDVGISSTTGQAAEQLCRC